MFSMDSFVLVLKLGILPLGSYVKTLQNCCWRMSVLSLSSNFRDGLTDSNSSKGDTPVFVFKLLRIRSDFRHEKKIITEKYTKANFPINFISSVVKQFEKRTEEKKEEDDLIIPKDIFHDEIKPFVLAEIPFCQKNEEIANRFLKKFHDFTKGKFAIAIKWKTKKMKQLFSTKERNPYPTCKIFEGTCNDCGENYIGETLRNVKTRWKEHEDIRKDSEPARHLGENPSHSFTWKVLSYAPTKKYERKNLESSWIALRKPTLNEQVKFKVLTLFRNGVT